MKLVALSGYARSGKDTAAQVLRGEGWHRAAFADKIRDFALAIDPVVGTIVERDTHFIRSVRLSEVIERFGWNGYKESVYCDEIRRLLQRLGTEGGRDILGENTWVDATLNALDPDKNYILTDCRFLNEAQAVQQRGGLVVRINRPGVGPANSHSSETGLDSYEFDAIVYNDDDHDALRERLLRVIRRLS